MLIRAAKAIFQAFWGDPTLTARKNVQVAVQRHARQISEIEYEKAMYTFYAQQAAELDPNEHWWEFAQAKQCWFDHKQNYEVEVGRLTAVSTRKNAAQAKLAALVQKKG